MGPIPELVGVQLRVAASRVLCIMLRLRESGATPAEILVTRVTFVAPSISTQRQTCQSCRANPFSGLELSVVNEDGYTEVDRTHDDHRGFAANTYACWT